eukprot:5499240-Amphidinium_carterae.1
MSPELKTQLAVKQLEDFFSGLVVTSRVQLNRVVLVIWRTQLQLTLFICLRKTFLWKYIYKFEGCVWSSEHQTFKRLPSSSSLMVFSSGFSLDGFTYTVSQLKRMSSVSPQLQARRRTEHQIAGD